MKYPTCPSPAMHQGTVQEIAPGVFVGMGWNLIMHGRCCGIAALWTRPLQKLDSTVSSQLMRSYAGQPSCDRRCLSRVQTVFAATVVKEARRGASISPSSRTASETVYCLLTHAREANVARTRNASELCAATRRDAFAVPLRNLAQACRRTRTQPCALAPGCRRGVPGNLPWRSPFFTKAPRRDTCGSLPTTRYAATKPHSRLPQYPSKTASPAC